MRKSKRINKKMKAHNLTVEQKLFEQMAAQYVENYGKILKDEASTLENMEFPGIDRLNKKIKNKTLHADRRRYAAWATGAVAACLLLFLLGPALLREAGNPPADISGDYAGDSQATYAFIQVSLDHMPENFTLTGTDQDLGKSIYYIEDAYEDHVVLTVEEAAASIQEEFAGLQEIEIRDQTVFGTAKPGYGVVKFEKDELLYTLTCHYDINTLAALCRALL